MREFILNTYMFLPVMPVIFWLIVALCQGNRKSNKNKRMPRFNIIHWLIFPRDVPDEKRTPYEMDYKLLYKRYPSRLEIFRYYTPRIKPTDILVCLIILIVCLMAAMSYILLKKLMISV